MSPSILDQLELRSDT